MFYRNYTETYLDPDLVSGLLSAFNNFSEVELNGIGIESINMGGLQWVYLNSNKLKMLVIAAETKSGNAEVMRSRLEVISKMFIQQFNIDADKMAEKTVRTADFEDFAATLDMLREQWEQADLVMNAAELFDLLGVFQQIFNLFAGVVQDNFKGDKYSIIVAEIKEYSKKMEKFVDIQNNPEFKKIEFDEEYGWSVITLDPTKLNKYLLKKALFLITSHLKIVLVKHLGYSETLYAMSKELLPYIFSSWELLEVLDVIKPLFTILLERPTIPL
jgi:phage anti-repressor protein